MKTNTMTNISTQLCSLPVLVSTMLFGVVVSGTYAAAESVQWSVKEGGNGHWYKHHTFDEPTHVLEVQDWAEGIGGYISSVRSDAENEWVWNVFGNSCLGGYQDFDASDFSEPNGGWRWANGEPWDYTNWLPGEPNNANGNEHGVAVCCPPHLKWNDIQIYNATYLIEFDADCNGDGIVDYGQILDGTLEDADNNGVPDICEQPGTLTVCVDGCDFTDIQSAIDAATSGSVIEVGPGVWNENLVVSGKSLEIIAVDGPDVTLLDGGNNGSVLRANDDTVSSLVVVGFTFLNGSGTDLGSTYPFHGGAILVWGNDLSLEDCRFVSNHADAGGAVYCQEGMLTLQDCVFTSNTARRQGGAAVCKRSDVLVYNCTFNENTCTENIGGAMVVDADSPETTVVIHDSTYSYNWAPEDGGGLHVWSAQLEIENTTFEGNDASQGGGLMVVGSPVSISGCTFRQNTAILPSSNEEKAGGGIEFHSCSGFVSGCLFEENQAHEGGGIAITNPLGITYPELEITDCSFDTNMSIGGGGGLYVNTAIAVVDASQFTDNNAQNDNGNAIWVVGDPSKPEIFLTYSDSSFCGSGLDPVESSSAWFIVDAGGNDISDECETCAADVTDDGQVTVNDLLVIIAQWGTEGPLGDIDQDGIVNITDLLLVIQSWGECS